MLGWQLSVFVMMFTLLSVKMAPVQNGPTFGQNDIKRDNTCCFVRVFTFNYIIMIDI